MSMEQQLINTVMYVMLYVSMFSTIYFFLTYFFREDRVKIHATTPFVTILVPAYNEEDCLEKTVLSLSALAYPKGKYEVIVLDDGSTDNTLKIANSLAGKVSCAYHVMSFPNGGKGKALNKGIAKAKGEIVGCLDADSFVDADALAHVIAKFTHDDVMAVTPAMKVASPKTILQRIQSVEYVMGIFLRKVFALINAIHVTPGPFTFFRKSFFEKYGGYDENNITEDIEIALRIQSKRYRIESAVDAFVYTNSPSKFKELNSQRVRWYSGFIQNITNYKHLFGIKHGIMGTVILPLAILSIVFSFISLSLFGYFQTKALYHGLQNFWLLQLDYFRFFSFSFDTFFLHLTPLTILGAFGLIFSILFIYVSAKLSKEGSGMILSYLYFIVCYGFLYTFWWGNAIYAKTLGVKQKWGEKKYE